MSKIEKAVQFMTDVANDAAHGYDQTYRWGENGDYDCSSLLITSWQTAGVPVKSYGAAYTGNMYKIFLNCGFKDVTKLCSQSTGSGMKRGDVLLNHVYHTAMYIGNGQLVQASINEKGDVRGGQPGDQKQLRGQKGEINICGYYNYPWDCILRYEDDAENSVCADEKESLVVDDSFGPATIIRTQEILGTEPDGVISNQPISNKKYLCAADETCWQFKVSGYEEGSEAVRAMQHLFGTKEDGWFGKNTVLRMQKFLGVAQDTSMGPETVKAWQRYLNKKSEERIKQKIQTLC